MQTSIQKLPLLFALILAVSPSACVAGTETGGDEGDVATQTQALVTPHFFSGLTGSGWVSTGKSSSTHACWLAWVSGALRSMADEVTLDGSSGTWTIHYGVASGTMGAGAYCAPLTDLGATRIDTGFRSQASGTPYFSFPNYGIKQGLSSTPLWPSSPTNFCYISGVAGQFNGGGESVRIRDAAGAWTQDTFAFTTIRQTAACVDTTHARGGMFSAGPNQDIPLESTATSICYLTRVEGKFASAADGVGVWITNGVYRLMTSANNSATTTCHRL